MQQDIKLYEKRVIEDREFPIHIGTRAYSSTFGFSPHWHEDIEIHYILSGKMVGTCNQEAYAAMEGDLAIANSNNLHSGHGEGEEITNAIVIILNMEALSQRLAARNIVFQNVISGDSVISTLMHQLYQEVTLREDGYRLMCKGIVLQLMAHLTRHYVKEELTEKESIRKSQKLERFLPVIQYVAKHYGEDVSNKDLADIIHLGEDRFNHLFKECMGVSPLQYINGIRMEKAMNFLKLGQYSSTEVASMVGIPDYNHFGRLFRRTYGCTPTQVFKEEKTVSEKNIKI